VYGSFVRSNNQNFDYIMLIDTEGLLSTEKGNEEYGRRLVLFCLAVSHLVIINISGQISEELKKMLELCANSLSHLGVDIVPKPVVHFVLNQQSNPNSNNHLEPMQKILTDIKKDKLSQKIDIRPETFHTLPSAFQKERFSFDHNDNEKPNISHTDPEFLEETQKLCNLVILSAKSYLGRVDEQFSDSSGWLRFVKTIFDTLLKFPDLTYFTDMNEKRQ
ncbi:unnamed protein product, partial [Didymodactylos carnosus]